MVNSNILTSRILPGMQSLFLAFCLVPLSALSQPADIPVEQLLFEPVPLTDDAQSPEFTSVGDVSSLNAAPSSPAAPAIAVEDEDDALRIIREIEQYLESVDDNEAEIGPFSDELQENLLSLGQLYQELGDHAQAIEHLQRVLNIIRINNGLTSLNQISVIDIMMPSFVELGRFKEADEMQELKLEIYFEAYGEQSLEIIPALLQLGNWNVQAFLDRSNILTNISRVDAGRFLMDPINYTQEVDDPRSSPLFNLYQAQSNFLNAINIIIQNKAFQHSDLLDLERKLVTTYFLRTHRENILYEPDFYLTRKKRKTGSRLNTNSIELMNSEDYGMGQASLKRSIAYIANDPQASPAALASAMLEDADWDLLYTRKVKSAEKYQEAYEFFASEPQVETQISGLIYPKVPKVLPVYLPAPNSREKLGIPADEDVNYLGYYDVSFNVDKYGKAKKIKILDESGAVTRNMEIRLSQYLRNVQFRPMFKDGKPMTDTISLRYNIGY